MDYGRAVEIGRGRAEEAAEAIRRWTGAEAMAVCAVKPAPGRGRWQPVGPQSLKEIARDDGWEEDYT